jgi:leucine dehydrogenase
MQGLGAVGGTMAKHLHDEGAILTGCDTNDSVFDDLTAQGLTIKRAGLDEIYDVPADIFAPNAIGGTLSDENIRRLQNAGVQIICGAANNQQEDQIRGSQSKLLHKLGMLYCPDYIVNAGGVIWVAMVGKDAKTITQDITTGVPKRFEDLLRLSRQHPDKDMASIARDYAKKRVERAKENNAKRKAG